MFHIIYLRKAIHMSRGSSVDIEAGYGMDDRKFVWALSLGLKRQGREANHSPLTSAEVKITWIYTSTPPYVFMA
jgi:hypothetical protein